METTHEQLLMALEKASQNPEVRDLNHYRIMHTLSEARYLPAFDILFEGLGDDNWFWREKCVFNIGHHYYSIVDERNKSKFVEKLKELLLKDPNENVRDISARILGIWSTWLDIDLISTLMHDKNAQVREASFIGLFRLAKLSPKQSLDFDREMNSGRYEPNIYQLYKILEEKNFNKRDELLPWLVE